VDDPDSSIRWNLLEMDCPARQLVDDRWVWLPAVLAGRVFTHRVSAVECTHDVLNHLPDLSPITALCEHAEYQNLADGSAASIAVAGYDDELIDERGIPPEAIDPVAVLLLAPDTLAKLGVADGDTIGLRLTAEGLVLERIDVIAENTAGARLAATLDADEPTYVDAAVWTACIADAALFTGPLPPLSEIVDDHGLARRGDSIAPSGFDFGRWQFERRCELLASGTASTLTTHWCSPRCWSCTTRRGGSWLKRTTRTTPTRTRLTRPTKVPHCSLPTTLTT
jgi:hypothetical protein